MFKAHRLCLSLNSRLESNKEEEEAQSGYERVGREPQCQLHGQLSQILRARRDRDPLQTKDFSQLQMKHFSQLQIKDFSQLIHAV